MVTNRTKAYIVAGLGTCLWSVPAQAFAVTVGQYQVDDAALGAVGGALLGTMVSSLILSAKYDQLKYRMEELEARAAAPARCGGAHAATGAARFTLAHPEDPAAVAAGLSFDAEYAEKNLEVVAAPAVAAAATPVASASPVEAQVASQVNWVEPAVPVEPTAPVAQAAQPAPAAPATPVAAAVPLVDAPQPQAYTGTTHGTHAATATPGMGGAASTVHAQAVPASDDYADIATEYVNRLTFGKRMANRAKGVAQLLGERLGGDPMEDLPMIPRADGTVGDVGTSWWDAAVSEQNRDVASTLDHTFDGVAAADEDFTTNAVMMGDVAGVAVAMTTGQWDMVGSRAAGATGTGAFVAAAAASRAQAQPQTPAAASPATSSFIPVGQAASAIHVATRPHAQVPVVVASPELTGAARPVTAPPSTVYAARAAAASLEAQDEWEKSLAAMDAKVDDNLITAPAAAFVDFVGDARSLDEPDGLETATNFLHFKTPAGHPEVQDTASYISYLVNAELGDIAHDRDSTPAA